MAQEHKASQGNPAAIAIAALSHHPELHVGMPLEDVQVLQDVQVSHNELIKWF